MQIPLEPGYAQVYASPTGGYVIQHETHDGQEAHDNLFIARMLADLGEKIKLLAVNETPGAKNPDATINGVLWEFKTLQSPSVNALDKAIQRGKKQAANILVHAPAVMSAGALQQSIFDRVQRSPGIAKIRVLHQGQVQEFTRAEILAPRFRLK